MTSRIAFQTGGCAHTHTQNPPTPCLVQNGPCFRHGGGVLCVMSLGAALGAGFYVGWISGFLDFWISGSLNLWISGFLDFPLSGSVCVCLRICLSSCVCVSLCLSVSVYVSASVFVSANGSVHACFLSSRAEILRCVGAAEPGRRPLNTIHTHER